jgi:hypothetical protein
VTYLSHTASFHSNERIAPSNRGIKHLDKLADHDVAEAYEASGGQGRIAGLAAEAMRARNIDL